MCDVCKIEGVDTKFRNGPKDGIYSTKFYCVFRGQVAYVKLCYLCSLKLFLEGESRFLKDNINFVKTLAENKRQYILR